MIRSLYDPDVNKELRRDFFDTGFVALSRKKASGKVNIQIIDWVITFGYYTTAPFILHEIGHILVRDPVLWYQQSLPKLNYGIRMPVTHEGGLRAVKHELQVFAIENTLRKHYTREKQNKTAANHVEFLTSYFGEKVPDTQLQHMMQYEIDQLVAYYNQFHYTMASVHHLWSRRLSQLSAIRASGQSEPQTAAVDGPTPPSTKLV